MGILIGWRCDSQNGQFSMMFTHDLRDTIVNVTFRRTVKSLVSNELNSLAKAAVAGDETALDTLTNWRPRTAARGMTHAGTTDNQCFYVCCQSGTVFYIIQSGACNEVIRSPDSPIVQMLWHPKREVIVALMEDLFVGHYMVESGGALTELERVKLSGKVPGKNGEICWASSAIAVITGDFTVRIFDLDTSDSFLLSMKQPTKSTDEMPEPVKEVVKSPPIVTKYKSILERSLSDEDSIIQDDDHLAIISTSSQPPPTLMEVFTCIAYCADNQTLCAGTNLGNLYIWKKNTTWTIVKSTQENGMETVEHLWQLYNVVNVQGAIKHCSWGVCDVSMPCVLLNCVSNVYILKV